MGPHLITAVSSLVLGSSALAQDALLGLGFLPGQSNSDASAVSGDGGTVVGGSPTRDGNAFIWTSSGGIRPLTLPAPYIVSAAYCISADGSVAGGQVRTSTPTSWPCRWIGESLVLVPPGTGFYSVATLNPVLALGINGDPAVGYALRTPSSALTGFRWTEAGGMVFLGSVAGFSDTFALAASADGTVVAGYARVASQGIRPVRWDSAGTMFVLPVLAGDTCGEVQGASADGRVLVGETDNCGGSLSHPVRWVDGVPSPLPIPMGALFGDAEAVSGDGQLIVGEYTDIPNISHAVLWRDGVLVNIQGELAARGVDVSNWQLGSAHGVNADGTVIVGRGYHSITHQYEAYRAVLSAGPPLCYANCDGSTAMPILNVNDFICFQNRFVAGDTYANCDGSANPPILNINDFICFQSRFAAGCP